MIVTYSHAGHAIEKKSEGQQSAELHGVSEHLKWGRTGPVIVDLPLITEVPPAVALPLYLLGR